MTAVKKNVDEVEESVATAERELGSHTIQKVLSSIPGLRQVGFKCIPGYNLQLTADLIKSIRNKTYIARK